MRASLFLVYFFLFNLSPLLLISQKGQEIFPFHHIEYYGSQQGLNGNEVEGITQDNYGFMWFLTDNGLNRFDGYSFRSFSYDPGKPGSPSVDWLTCLTAGKNRVWFSTENTGIYSLDLRRESFSNYRFAPGKKGSLSDGPVFSTAENSDGSLWCSLPDGLNKYDPQTMQFTFYGYDDLGLSTLNDAYIKELIFDTESKTDEAKNELWVATNLPSIELCDIKAEKVIKKFPFPYSSKIMQNGFYISRIKNKKMWIGSDREGVYGFDTEKQEFIKISINGKNYQCQSLRHGLHPAIEDHSGNIWTSNDNNEIVFYEKSNNKTYFFKVNKKFTGFRFEWPVFYEDKSHKVWIGTYEGLIAIDNKPRRFFSLKHDENDGTSISSDHIYAIFKDRGGRMYVAGKSIDMFDRSTNTFSQLKFFENNTEVRMDPAWYIKEDSKGIIWFTLGRDVIVSLDPVTKRNKVHRLYDKSGELQGGFVGIAEGKNGKYWTVSWENKICLYDPITGNAKIYPISSPVNPNRKDGTTTLFMSSKNILYSTIWQGGMVAFDTEKGTYKVYNHDPNDPNSLSQETATVVMETKKGLIWLFTLGGGICVFDPITEKFKAFTTKDGLAHNIASGIIEDKNGNYWVSTRGGLSRFKPPENPFAVDCKIEFRNYYASDGLPSNVMNMLSAFCDDDGTLFFGTKDAGLFYFHPDSLKDNSFVPPVHITGFSLLNKPQGIQDSNTVLRTSIELTKEIKLSYRQNTISFSFSALNYVSPEKNKYRYLLEGYDKDWIETDASKRFADYTNLDHGIYTFKVMASNNDGRWNETPTELKIMITPPFWQTTWFRVLIVLAVLTIAYAFYRYRIGQLLLLQRIRNKIAADLHDDIGSTLNSISVYSEVAKKDPSRNEFALNMIGESSRKIIDSMSDIVWSINPENDSFDKLIFRMRSLAYNITKAKKVDFTFKADESLGEVRLSMHIRRNFYLIYKEALNNLVKYSQANGASVILTHESQQVILIVKDNGIGFDPNVKYNGNGLNNIRKRAHEINARLTIDSSAGNGTTIELNFKV